MTSRTEPKWIKKALLAVTSLILTLGLLEGGSRLLGEFPPPKDPLQSKYVFAGMGQYDHLLFWTLRPGATDDEGRPWINSHGLRGPEVGPKAPDEVRILSLGESTTFARRMEYEQCYSALVEAGLPEVWGTQRPVRVINAGVPAYSLFQGYQYLVHHGLDLDPDLVLLYFGHNDSLPVSFLNNRASIWRGDTRALNDWELYNARQSVTGRLSEFLMKYSNAYRGLLQWSQGGSAEPAAGEGPGDADPDDPGDPGTDAPEPGTVGTDPAAADGAGVGEAVQTDKPRVPAAHREQLLSQFQQVCRERGITLVVIIPWYRDVNDHAELLRRFTAEHGIPVVDLLERLPDRLDRPWEEYFSDKVHPIPEGHRLMSEEILDVLAELAPSP